MRKISVQGGPKVLVESHETGKIQGIIRSRDDVRYRRGRHPVAFGLCRAAGRVQDTRTRIFVAVFVGKFVWQIGLFVARFRTSGIVISVRRMVVMMMGVIVSNGDCMTASNRVTTASTVHRMPAATHDRMDCDSKNSDKCDGFIHRVFSH